MSSERGVGARRGMQGSINQTSNFARGARVSVRRLHSLRLSLIAAACSVILSMLAACSSESPTTPSRRPNFILIVVDALRADRLHYAGCQKELSPNFDKLQNQSASFFNAYAPSSWTLPSMASVFLGQPPSKHKVVHFGSSLSGEETTFVEKLHEMGYRTGGWSANTLMGGSRGFARGFDEYQVVMDQRWHPGVSPESEYSRAPASEVTSQALVWLRDASAPDSDAPFFAYLHYMETHTPLLCADSADDKCKVTAAALTRRLLTWQWDFTGPEQAIIRNLYDTGVARMDAALGDLYSKLNANGLLNHTWLIVTADHGEMLGEQDSYLHGNTLYQPVLSVPLLIRSPSGRRSVVDFPVSLTDLGPTILDLAGVEAPGSIRGRSFRKALEGNATPFRPVVSQLFPVDGKPRVIDRHLLAVTDGTTNILVGVDGKLERFNLSEDPQQLHPAPADSRELDEFLSEVGMTFNLSDALSVPSSDISPEMHQQLKALGYVH